MLKNKRILFWGYASLKYRDMLYFMNSKYKLCYHPFV